ncbi:MAG: type II secretion system protein [Dehalococcoidales bacterium]
MRFLNMCRAFVHCEAGTTLLEVVVALAILGSVAVGFLGGLVTTSRATLLVDERATALSLAQSQMEWAQNSSYTDNATSYSTAPIPAGSEYANYSVNITAQPLHNPDDGIQKLTAIVIRSGEQIITIEGYKVDR